MQLLDNLMFSFEKRLENKSISKKRKSIALKEFAEWINSELIDNSETEILNAGISDFFSIDNRIKRWQDYYSHKPDDCPESEWPIFKRYEYSDKQEYGRTPIHRAVINNNTKLIKELISKGEYKGEKDNGGNTAFELAVLEGKEDIVNIFLDMGIYN